MGETTYDWAGKAYLFVKPGLGWNMITPVTSAQARFTGGAERDEFGWTVAISADGSKALMGASKNDANGKDNAGAAYLFNKPAEGWNGGTRSATDADMIFQGENTIDEFGSSVAISADGNTALIGAHFHDADGKDNAGAAYFYTPLLPPTASFTYTQISGTLAVQFTDTSTNKPNSWLWLFGDSYVSSIDKNPQHVYNSPGTYNVLLQAKNIAGSHAVLKTITVTPPPTTPVASFTATPNSGTAPLSVRFTDTSTNSPTSWSWTFGDGGTSTVQSPEHTYASAGTFTATLVAKNTAGQSSASSTITAKSTSLTAPLITSVAPKAGQQGGKYTVTITGTNFVKNKSTVKVSGKGVTVGKYKSRSTTKIVVPITIAKTAKTGATTVTVTNPSSGLKSTKAFTVKTGPKIKKISAPTGVKGKQYTITITGTNFEKDRSTVKVSGTGVTVGKYKTRTTKKIVVPFTVSKKAKVGVRTVTVKNPKGGGTATCTFKVKGTSTPSALVWSSDPVTGIQRPVVLSQNVPGLPATIGKIHPGNSIISPLLMAGTGRE